MISIPTKFPIQDYFIFEHVLNVEIFSKGSLISQRHKTKENT